MKTHDQMGPLQDVHFPFLGCIADAAYCYRPSSVVCRLVGLSVYRSVTLVSPAKMAAPIQMPFGLRTRLDPGNHVLDGFQIPPWERAILRGKDHPIVKYRDTLWTFVQKQLNRSRCRLDWGRARTSRKNYVRWGYSGAEGRCHGNLL